ncbi:MAG: efflux RND transporter permease subunit [Magnetococcales bacterium]|nr:efflux RND transporter permease subunit [Magnetococcales bacterium]
MIQAVIRWSILNRLTILLLAAVVVLAGFYAVRSLPVEALPDLSDVQVIIKTDYPGQAPQVVEDQVTYPLTTVMLSVPSALTVRGYSFFGSSYVYITFADGTDPYWARSRVLEYLSQLSSRLPAEVHPTLGPDATGVGWVFQYALVDRSGQYDLSQLRSMQDWFLKFELQTVPGVSEVVTVGGMVRQYQVILDPVKMRAYNMPLAKVKEAIRNANQEIGGSVVDMAEAEYMVRATGNLKNLDDISHIPLGLSDKGIPILLSDIAELRIGPQMRRGVAELDGLGEVVGGLIVMRHGENSLNTIEGVKQKLQSLQKGLPEGVEVVTTYDRSDLIGRVLSTLKLDLLESALLVAVISFLLLLHFSSALVVAMTLLTTFLATFLLMRLTGITADTLSVGGLLLSVGMAGLSSLVMTASFHRHLESHTNRDPERMDAQAHWLMLEQTLGKVAPILLFILLLVLVASLPLLLLEAQEGKYFTPFILTQTTVLGLAVLFTLTLVPVLTGYLVKGSVLSEESHPINGTLKRFFRPTLTFLTRSPQVVLILSLVSVGLAFFPLHHLGSQFMPETDEGDLMYVPTTFPGISMGKAQQILQQTNEMIRSVPEVKQVFGKVGRTASATDSSSLALMESIIQLKPRHEWRAGMGMEEIRAALDQTVKLPGIANGWVMPIQTRVDQVATGIRTPVGIKISGVDLEVIQLIGAEIEKIIRTLPGTGSIFAERVVGGRYITVDVDRLAAAGFGLNIAGVHEIVRTAIGGMTVAYTLEGMERYPINIRYPKNVHDSVEQLKNLSIVTPGGSQISLQDVTTIRVTDGPPMIKSENARMNGWITIDVKGRDIGSFVAEAQQAVSRGVILPDGYTLSWSGHSEYLQRAKERFTLIAPVALVIILLFVSLGFRPFQSFLIIVSTLPVALVGAVWLLYFLTMPLSVAVGVGLIILSAMAVGMGGLMMTLLEDNLAKSQALALREDRTITLGDLRHGVVEGALLSLRPILSVLSALLVSLLPVLINGGGEVRILHGLVTPLLGGLVSTALFVLLVIPPAFFLWKKSLLNPSKG